MDSEHGIFPTLAERVAALERRVTALEGRWRSIDDSIRKVRQLVVVVGTGAPIIVEILRYWQSGKL